MCIEECLSIQRDRLVVWDAFILKTIIAHSVSCYVARDGTLTSVFSILPWLRDFKLKVYMLGFGNWKKSRNCYSSMPAEMDKCLGSWKKGSLQWFSGHLLWPTFLSGAGSWTVGSSFHNFYTSRFAFSSWYLFPIPLQMFWRQQISSINPILMKYLEYFLCLWQTLLAFLSIINLF